MQLKLNTVFLLIPAVAILAGGCSMEKEDKTDSRPNILVILADDMGYSDIGCYGGEIETPNLDRLAADGLRIRNIYNGARCCPTRASLLTGLYPHEAGIGGMVRHGDKIPESGPYQGYLSLESVTIAEVLREAGYSTYLSGKWHVGEWPDFWPRKRGFDRYFGLINGASSYFEIDQVPRVLQMVQDDTPWTPPAEGFYMTNAFTEHAVKFIDEHHQTTENNPFFLYLAYTAPHWPLHALEEDMDKYRGMYDAGWDSLRVRRFARQQELGLVDGRYELPRRPESIPAWDDLPDADKKEWAARMEAYAAMVDRMDQGIGEVLEALRRHDALDNTLIFFLSDNGACAVDVGAQKIHDPAKQPGQRGSYLAYLEPWAFLSNTPYRQYKQWTYEGGIASPLIVHWPEGISDKGVIRKHTGHVMDIMATVVDVTGATYPEEYAGRKIKPLRGESLLPAIRGEHTDPERILCWEHYGSKAIRKGNWKLVQGQNSTTWELYNLETDPVEIHDMSTREPELKKELLNVYSAWAKDMGVNQRKKNR